MIKIIQGDITTLAVDAIVNAANQMMLGNAPKKLVSEGNFERSENLSEAKALKRSRGGVDGAIHSAAGRSRLLPQLARTRGGEWLQVHRLSLYFDRSVRLPH